MSLLDIEESKILLEMNMISRSQEIIKLSNEEFETIYKNSISLIKKYFNKLPQLRKFINYKISDIDDLKNLGQIQFFRIDAWDINKNARNIKVFKSEIEPLFNQVINMIKTLNEVTKSDPVFKYFLFTVDGDWDDLIVQLSLYPQYRLA